MRGQEVAEKQKQSDRILARCPRKESSPEVSSANQSRSWRFPHDWELHQEDVYELRLKQADQDITNDKV